MLSVKNERTVWAFAYLDLDPKFFDCLQYCTNITEPGPTVSSISSIKKHKQTSKQWKRKNIYTEVKGAFATKTIEELNCLPSGYCYIIQLICENLQTVSLVYIRVKLIDLESYRHMDKRRALLQKPVLKCLN